MDSERRMERGGCMPVSDRSAMLQRSFAAKKETGGDDYDDHDADADELMINRCETNATPM